MFANILTISVILFLLGLLVYYLSLKFFSWCLDRSIAKQNDVCQLGKNKIPSHLPHGKVGEEQCKYHPIKDQLK
jgi:hypothetical protein